MCFKNIHALVFTILKTDRLPWGDVTLKLVYPNCLKNQVLSITN